MSRQQIKNCRWKILSILGLALPFLLVTQEVKAQADFFAGKTITLIQGRRPGGTGDMRVRSVVPSLQKHIPGNPAIISEFMPGAGGRTAANHLYNNARPDGLTMANISSTFIDAAILGQKGVQYDLDKLIYLGSPLRGGPQVFFTRKDAGFSSIEKLRATPGVRIGSLAVGHSVYYTGRIFAYVLRLRNPNFVVGYSGPELDVALDAGEVDARTAGPDTPLRRNLIGKVDFHAIIELPKGEKYPHPAFAQLPDLDTFAKSDLERRVIGLWRAFRDAGSPFILPPGTPKDRVEVLQEAFRKALKDPGFHNEWKKLTGEDAAPLMPEELAQLVRDRPRDPEAIDLFKTLSGPNPLPTPSR
jgi:tripartite-type tricarboxylate transporter receptor subunit TctC